MIKPLPSSKAGEFFMAHVKFGQMKGIDLKCLYLSKLILVGIGTSVL